MQPKVLPGKSPKGPPRISVPRARLVSGTEATSRVQQHDILNGVARELRDKLSIGGETVRENARDIASRRVVRNLLTNRALSLNTKVASLEDLSFLKIYVCMYFLLLYLFSYFLSLSSLSFSHPISQRYRIFLF